MRGAIPPLFQYALVAWCSVKAQGQLCLYIFVNLLYCFINKESKENLTVNTLKYKTNDMKYTSKNHVILKSVTTLH
jgi:hypothetical protein